MKEYKLKMWEVTKEELQKIAKNYPAYRILIQNRFFPDNKIVRADTVLKKGCDEDFYIFTCFDDPSRYIK